jgi:hypothetical protein
MALKAGARRIADALRFHKGGIDAAHAQGRTTSHVAVPEVWLIDGFTKRNSSEFLIG